MIFKYIAIVYTSLFFDSSFPLFVEENMLWNHDSLIYWIF